MFCINCFHKTTSVTNSRPNKKQPQIWRRRKCPECSYTFTTYERPSLSDNTPIRLSNGDEDKFNLGQLTLSIAKAFSHNPKQAKRDTFWLAQTVEDVLSVERQSITPEDIAATTHQVLKRYDEMAAMQYAIQQNLIVSTKRRGRPSLS